jgi:hypothetical protein
MKDKTKPYTEEDLESFASGIVSVNSIIETANPDVLIAPMMGAVPFIDCLNAVNPHFDNSRVFYVPASSSLASLNNILPQTVANLLYGEIHEIPQRGLKIMTLDEVVSGSSAIRVKDKVSDGISRYISRLGLSAEEVAKINLSQIGIEHGIYRESGKDWNERFKKLVEDKLIDLVRVNRIIPMDNPRLCPVSYIPKREDKSRNTPIVRTTSLSMEYIRFLSEIAAVTGTDPDMAVPRNYKRIFDHQKYIPKRYKSTD